jgi:ribosomal protein L31
MRILLKYPTRGRPLRFLETLLGWIVNAENPELLSVLVSYDKDDSTMTPAIIAKAEAYHPALICIAGNSRTKIEACNADINEYGGTWDVILLVSDDMFCRRKGWDTMIRKHMMAYFPDTDGALWFWDGSQRAINTLECVGRKRYEAFRYLYHPTYASFFCDNEQSDIGVRENKLVFVETPICSHEHPAWAGGMKPDATYQRNNKYWKQDKSNYERRKAANFPR